MQRVFVTWNTEELYEFMQHGYEYYVAAFVTFETKLHIMKPNKLCSVNIYNFYAIIEFGRNFNNRNQGLSTSGKTFGYSQGSECWS